MHLRSIRRFILPVVLALVMCTLLRADDEYYLKKLIVANSLEEAAAATDAEGGSAQVVVIGVPFLQDAGFEEAIHPFLGKPIGTDLLNGLIRTITQYARTRDILVPNVQVPNSQNIRQGTLRLAVSAGRYNQLIFSGNHWFTDRLLQQKLGIKPGDEIRTSVLEEAVNWANSNPFRQMKVLVNETRGTAGKADIYINVEDVRPVRLAAAYNNEGIPILGRNQYSASIQFGNMWGRDHQGSYQFITNGNPDDYQAHVAAYTIPLPWRHYLEFNASYMQAKPSLYGGLLTQRAETTAANFRYRMPSGFGDHVHEWFVGGDFKESNNNLAYGGTSVSAGKLDIFEAVVGVSAVRRDAKGAWVFGVSANLSPGNVNSRNSDRAFQPEVRDGELIHVGRLGARARYATATLSVQRQLNLSQDWQLFSRFVGQLASSNLVSDEQLSIGGSGTIRGFNPNVFTGEQGFILNNDLQTPEWRRAVEFLPKNRNNVSARLTFFYDVGQVFYKIHYPTTDFLGRRVGWDDSFLRPLAGAGVGLRLSVASNFSLSFDYGWQVTHPKAPLDSAGRGHIKAVLAF